MNLQHLFGILGFSLALAAGTVSAAPVRLCVSETALPPFTYPDRESDYQRELRRLIEARGDTLDYLVRPWRRCLDEFVRQLNDGLAVGGINELTLRHGIFPRDANGGADTALAVAADDYVVLRRKGEAARWDGNRFIDLDTPIIVISGTLILQRKLEALHVPVHNQALTDRQALRMLIGKRAQLAVVQRNAARDLLRRGDADNELEILDKPLAHLYGYLIFSHRFAAERPGYAESIWQALAKWRTAGHKSAQPGVDGPGFPPERGGPIRK